MKTIIIGMQGAGKTTLIKNKIIPLLPNINDLIILDYYNEFLEYSKNRVDFSGLNFAQREHLTIKTITESPKNTVFLFDEHQGMLNPKKEQNEFSHQYLYDAIGDRKSIHAFRSIKSCDLIHIINPNYPISKIYLFPTFDDKRLIQRLPYIYHNKIEFMPSPSFQD